MIRFMLYLSGFRNKEDDNGHIQLLFLLFIVFFILKAILQSGHLLFYVICLISGIVVYYVFGFLQKKILSRPASLGKAYAKKYPIIVQYAPPKGINPAEAGLLYNRSVEPTDLTSLIYQWKFENLIEVKTFVGDNSKKDYIKLIKKEDIPLTRPLFETEIFDSLFAVSGVKIIEGAFQLRYALMLEDLEYHGIRKGWVYRFSLGKGWKVVYNILVFLLFLGVYLLFFVETWYHLPLFLVFLVLLFLVCIFLGGLVSGGGRLKYTEKGAELASKVIGYRNFIKSCDEDKIKFLLKEDPLFVDRTLPYATAFGLETEFLKKISPLRKDWNAKYVRGTKMPFWVRILSFFIKN